MNPDGSPLPVSGQDRSNVTRPLIDRLIPGDVSVIGTELDHGLDQLVCLGIEQGPAIVGSDGFGLVAATGVPSAPPCRLTGKDKVQRIDAELDRVLVAGRCVVVGDAVEPVAAIEDIGVVAA